MGQYYYIINPKKRQYLNPHKFGCGLKLLEFGCSANGPLLGMAILMADGNGRGGGDLHSKNKLIGSWAGDPVIVSGDYATKEGDVSLTYVTEADRQNVIESQLASLRKERASYKKKDDGEWNRFRGKPAHEHDAIFAEEEKRIRARTVSLQDVADYGYKDISFAVIRALCDDEYVRNNFQKSRIRGAGGAQISVAEAAFKEARKKVESKLAPHWGELVDSARVPFVTLQKLSESLADSKIKELPGIAAEIRKTLNDLAVAVNRINDDANVLPVHTEPPVVLTERKITA